jgi:hypothetical protein
VSLELVVDMGEAEVDRYFELLGRVTEVKLVSGE